MSAWTAYHQRILESANEQELANGLAGLKNEFQQGRWIDPTNEFVENAGARTRKVVQSGTQISGPAMIQYVAASSTLHCADGWSYLGRSLDAAIRGSPDVARHLAYYSELRAAMALLAAHSIAVFSHHGVVISDRTQTDVLFGFRTHDLAWAGLRAWAVSPQAARLVPSYVTPDGKPLSHWLDAFPAPASTSAVLEDWFTKWGVDIRLMAQDRDSRNIASYNPNGIKRRPLVPPRRTLELVAAMWRSCEPRLASRFSTLDLHLLRLALETNYHAVTGKPPVADPNDYKTRIEQMLKTLGYPDAVHPVLTGFLVRADQPQDHPVIAAARQPVNVGAAEHHLEAACRALLLLRIATGAVSARLKTATVGRADLAFWWTEVGETAGLWEIGSPPAEINELWNDIQIGIEDIETWMPAAPKPSLYEALDARSQKIASLSTMERAGLWGLGL